MDEQTILEMIGMIADMDNVQICEIEKDGTRIRVEKTGSPIESVADPIPEMSGFASAKNYTPAAPDTTLASPGQVKYARDMINKEFGTNYDRARDFLAHVWELPYNDVPAMDTWDETLTIEMAGAVLDYMENHKRGKRERRESDW